MRNQSLRPSLIVAAAACAVAVGLYFAPPELSERLRSSVLDVSAPGQMLMSTAQDQLRSAYETTQSPEHIDTELEALRQQLDASEQARRALAVENANLNEQLAGRTRTGASPYRATAGEPLLVPELLEARVIGSETADSLRSEKFLDAGSAEHLRADSLVLTADNPVLDQGLASAVEADQPVYAGRTIIGKVASAGRLTSSLQLVTHRDYRGGAQIYRRTPQGLVAGAQGILNGRGEPLCQMTLVAATEPVEIGDEVYSASREGMLSIPMYYGKVVKADLSQGDLQWEIWVEPAMQPDKLDRVAILRQKLNPARLPAE